MCACTFEITHAHTPAEASGRGLIVSSISSGVRKRSRVKSVLFMPSRNGTTLVPRNVLALLCLCCHGNSRLLSHALDKGTSRCCDVRPYANAALGGSRTWAPKLLEQIPLFFFKMKQRASSCFLLNTGISKSVFFSRLTESWNHTLAVPQPWGVGSSGLNPRSAPELFRVKPPTGESGSLDPD